MVFSSAVFLFLFLPIVFVCNLFIKKELSNYFLLAASLGFYAWGEPYNVLLMVVSILSNWIVGILLSRYKDHKRKLIVSVMYAPEFPCS